MNTIFSFVIWMFCVRYCTYQGAKRLIGPYGGFLLGALFTFGGILLVRSSRLLLDDKNLSRDSTL